VLTGYYISRDTIYGPERSGEFYVRGERIYLSRRALAGRARIPGASVREVGRVLGDLAGMPRATGTEANRVAGHDVAPIPTGYFTINGLIYGGFGRASDAVSGALRPPVLPAPSSRSTKPRPGSRFPTLPTADERVAARPAPTAAAVNVSAQLSKGEFRILGNLIYGPPGRRVPWLAAMPQQAVELTRTTHSRQSAAPTAGRCPTRPKRAKKPTRRKAA
jgi:hypothetical protein